MDEGAIEILKNISENHRGIAFSDIEGNKLKALFNDYSQGNYRSEIKCIITTYQEGVYDELSKMDALSSLDAEKLISKLSKNCFWKEDISHFAITAWAYALGLIENFDALAPSPDLSEPTVEETTVSSDNSLEKPTQNENAEEQFKLGIDILDRNEYGSRDEGIELLRKSAQNGHAKAQVRLGRIYCNTYAEEEYGVKKDFKEARKWFETAADQGDKSAKMWIKGNNIFNNFFR